MESRRPAAANAPSPGRAGLLRLRPDLVVRARRFGRDSYWIVYDPLTRRHFHFRDEEHALLMLLDGESSLQEIRERFERTQAPRRVDLRRLEAFCSQLHRDGLLLASGPGQAEHLLRRRADARRERFWRTAANPLAIRIPGWNPDRFLNWLAPRCGWLFSTGWNVGCLTMIASALLLVLLRSDELPARLPQIGELLAAGNLFWLAVALASTKALHELAHALTLKHFGGECHELGVMLLMFTPCLYCDVSDAWLLKNRWQRAAVGAAGMYAELTTAALATWIWWFSRPGELHMACLGVIVVCGAGTVLFNANPLLRFDGYFILSDLLEIPNLWQQSQAAARHFLRRAAFGETSDTEHRFESRHAVPLASYAVVSFVYRAAMLTAVLLFVDRAMRARRLETLGQLLMAIVVLGIAVGPARSVRRFLVEAGMQNKAGKKRAAWFAAAAAALVVVGLFAPLPCRVSAPAVFEVQDAAPIYVTVPGTLVDCSPPGVQVERGRPIARLENPTLERDVAALAGEYEVGLARLAHCERRRGEDAEAEALLPALRESLADLADRLRQRRLDQGRLTLEAPRTGTLLPPPAVRPKASDAHRLSSWSGTPGEERNRGGYLETGTLIGWIAEPGRFDAVAYVDETDVEFVRLGQTVALRPAAYPSETVYGRVVELAKVDASSAPAWLLAARAARAARQTGDADGERPLYQARMTLDHVGVRLLHRSPGDARIRVAPQSLAFRIRRSLELTFGLDLR